VQPSVFVEATSTGQAVMKHARRNRYGLEPLRTVREVAAELGISHARVMQLERSAFAKLRMALGDDELEAIAPEKPQRALDFQRRTAPRPRVEPCAYCDRGSTLKVRGEPRCSRHLIPNVLPRSARREAEAQRRARR